MGRYDPWTWESGFVVVVQDVSAQVASTSPKVKIFISDYQILWISRISFYFGQPSELNQRGASWPLDDQPKFLR